MAKAHYPHPVPLPMGEGTPEATAASELPLPWGEGWGEGVMRFVRIAESGRGRNSRLQNQRLRDAFGFLHLAGNFLLDSLFLGGDGGEPVFLALQRIEVVAAEIGA